MENEVISKEYFVIDRFEGVFVTLQNLGDGEVFAVERNMFYETPKEGNVVYLNDGLFKADIEKTEERRASINSRVKKLFGRKKRLP